MHEMLSYVVYACAQTVGCLDMSNMGSNLVGASALSINVFAELQKMLKSVCKRRYCSILLCAGVHLGPGKLPQPKLQHGTAALHPDWGTILNAMWALISRSDFHPKALATLCDKVPQLGRIIPDLEINLPVQMTAGACCLILCQVSWTSCVIKLSSPNTLSSAA